MKSRCCSHCVAIIFITVEPKVPIVHFFSVSVDLFLKRQETEIPRTYQCQGRLKEVGWFVIVRSGVTEQF